MLVRCRFTNTDKPPACINPFTDRSDDVFIQPSLTTAPRCVRSTGINNNTDIIGNPVLFNIVKTDEFHGKRQDRKSTRLNSSHVSISYAVFCLQKKTTK